MERKKGNNSMENNHDEGGRGLRIDGRLPMRMTFGPVGLTMIMDRFACRENVLIA